MVFLVLSTGFVSLYILANLNSSISTLLGLILVCSSFSCCCCSPSRCSSSCSIGSLSFNVFCDLNKLLIFFSLIKEFVEVDGGSNEDEFEGNKGDEDD